MAVAPGADPIDVALDQLGAMMQWPRPKTTDGKLLVALICASLWHAVFDGAMRRGDAALMALASREWKHAREAIQVLTPGGLERRVAGDAPAPSPP